MQTSFRIKIISVGFIIAALLILARLFYWQVLAADRLMILAQAQRESVIKVAPLRGEILASDGLPLVGNQEAYLAYLLTSDLTISLDKAAEKMASILAPTLDEIIVATDTPRGKQKQELIKNTEENLIKKLKTPGVLWVALKHKINPQQKQTLEEIDLKGLNFESEQRRIYPEASMAAHLLGFVGSDSTGEDIGYFGVEGFYDLTLKGRYGILRQEKDAINKPILIGDFFDQEKRDGQVLQLHLDRAIQFMVEKHLRDALGRYGAKSGSVIMMDPKTGAILAMASEPSYEPRYYFKYANEQYKNPLINELYEPGSTFKVITMAAALQEEKITPETQCDICGEAYKIDKYTIRTWDDKYHPQATMTEVLQYSDNVGMVFVGQKLGIENFTNYIRKFGFGKKTNIDLQEEVSGNLREQWSEVDLATAAFGQGIAVTGIQMLTAVGAIANDGRMMAPQVVDKIIDLDKEVEIKPRMINQVIDKEVADTLTAMMVEAVDRGEARWAKPKGYKIAGKTGTSQIPISGHYDEEKTIASFIGFAPADNPQFVMLTKLREPSSSPWGSETAAPLFFDIAKDVLLYWGIPPSVN